jgi:hypothetical protein
MKIGKSSETLLRGAHPAQVPGEFSLRLVRAINFISAVTRRSNMPAKSWSELTEKERRMEIARKTPRQLLYERMYHAVSRELIPEGDDRCLEEIFFDMDQLTVLMAIADLAGALIVDSAFIRNCEDCPKLTQVVTDEMRCQMEGTEVVEFLPPLSRPH